jgi:pimeloyl-ACP methyl ester carboxylesterase
MRSRHFPFPLVLAVLTAVMQSLAGEAVAQAFDPASMDPPTIDRANPPGMAELAFKSKGARLNGLIYLANGAKPHPTVILLHGFPGNERNLDLAQALRRAGMNVLFFSYRGAWGSAGTFSFASTIEDVASAVQYVRSDSSAKAFRIDPRHIVLVGHSMGGWLALMGAAADPTIRCAAALDFWNVGADGKKLVAGSAEDSTFTAYGDWLTEAGGPLRAESGRALTREVVEHANEWDLDNHAAELQSRPLLIMSTTRNEYHSSLMEALRTAGAGKVKALRWNTDHGFSAFRVRLARTLVSWLASHCD